MTGDPVGMLLPADASREDIDRIVKLFGLDQPLYVQFARFLGGLCGETSAIPSGRTNPP